MADREDIRRILKGTLDKKKKNIIVKDINDDLRLEACIMSIIRSQGRKVQKKILQKGLQEQMSIPGDFIGSKMLSNISNKAAFSGKVESKDVVLPITRETIDDFLNSDE